MTKRLLITVAAVVFVAGCIATEPQAAPRHHHRSDQPHHYIRDAKRRAHFRIHPAVQAPVRPTPIQPAHIESEPEPPYDATGCEGPWSSLEAGNTPEEVQIDTEIREWCEEGAPLPTEEEIEAWPVE